MAAGRYAWGPVPASSYFPNDFGLYNTSGNVAEMLFEEGLAIGGGWRSDRLRCANREPDDLSDTLSRMLAFALFW